MPIKFSKKFHRGIYANKIHVKDTIVVPTRWKFNIQIPEGLYRSKIGAVKKLPWQKNRPDREVWAIFWYN